MTWGNPPKLEPSKPKTGKKITPEDLARSGSEDGHQAALFAWAADNIVIYPQLKWMFAIPNGGSRHIAEAVKLVGTGVRSGVPDVFLPYAAPNYMGLFIEMKVGKNKTSDNQDAWIEYLRSAGYKCTVCYSWEEAKIVIMNYLDGQL